MPPRETDHPVYEIWKKMRYRCNVPGNKDYPRYGGRGIKVFEPWNYDFVSFRKWALAADWQPGLTLDRIDVDGDYEPDNCRWVTMYEQTDNRRNTRYWQYYGHQWTARQLFKHFRPQVTWGTFRRRLYQGWPIEQALNYGKNERYKRNAS